jgi:hypothetical protein
MKKSIRILLIGVSAAMILTLFVENNFSAAFSCEEADDWFKAAQMSWGRQGGTPYSPEDPSPQSPLQSQPEPEQAFYIAESLLEEHKTSTSETISTLKLIPILPFLGFVETSFNDSPIQQKPSNLLTEKMLQSIYDCGPRHSPAIFRVFLLADWDGNRICDLAFLLNIAILSDQLSNREEVINQLLAAGASANGDSSLETQLPLHNALLAIGKVKDELTFRQYLNVIRLLLENGASPKKKCSDCEVCKYTHLMKTAYKDAIKLAAKIQEMLAKPEEYSKVKSSRRLTVERRYLLIGGYPADQSPELLALRKRAIDEAQGLYC